MIFYKAEHFFEAKYPTLEEHEVEIWYSHPKWDIKCNQLGVLDFNEEILTFTYTSRDQYKIRRKGEVNTYVLGSKERIVMECYTGQDCKGFNFFHVDANPLNLTFENLVFFRNKAPGIDYYKRQKKEFIQRTLDYMKSREPLVQKRGISPEDYWTAMELPDWLIREWRVANGLPVKERTKVLKERRQYVTGAEQEMLVVRIKELRQGGASWKDIQEILEIKSKSRLKYLVKKAEIL